MSHGCPISCKYCNRHNKINPKKKCSLYIRNNHSHLKTKLRHLSSYSADWRPEFSFQIINSTKIISKATAALGNLPSGFYSEKSALACAKGNHGAKAGCARRGLVSARFFAAETSQISVSRDFLFLFSKKRNRKLPFKPQSPSLQKQIVDNTPHLRPSTS